MGDGEKTSVPAVEPIAATLWRLRRRLFLGALGGGFIGGIGGIGYMRWIEPSWWSINRETVGFPRSRLTAPVKLLHLSDFHASRQVPFGMIEEAVDLGIAEEPDIICVTGDFITSGMPDGEDRYEKILRKLAGTAPVYACLGNHDGGAWARRHSGGDSAERVLQLLARAGVVCLVNEAARVTINGVVLRLVGLGDLWSREMEPGKCLPPSGSEGPEPLVLLAHNPDSKDRLTDFGWDLMLCGHTHGGQLKIPFLGVTPFAPVEDHSIVEGLHLWKGRRIHVTRGVGNLHGMRFNCRPQISVLNLVPEG